MIKNYLPKNLEELSHAYIIESRENEIVSSLKKYAGEIISGVEVVHLSSSTLSITDAREIKVLSGVKKTQCFIISFDFITREAQNSLLKTLEEPASDTYFFMVTPSLHQIIETVLSRVDVIKIQGKGEFSSFIHKTPAEKIELVENLIKDIQTGSKTKENAIEWVEGIIEELNSIKKSENSEKVAKLEKIRGYLFDQGASVKQLLELAMLTTL